MVSILTGDLVTSVKVTNCSYTYQDTTVNSWGQQMMNIYSKSGNKGNRTEVRFSLSYKLNITTHKRTLALTLTSIIKAFGLGPILHCVHS